MVAIVINAAVIGMTALMFLLAGFMAGLMALGLSDGFAIFGGVFLWINTIIAGVYSYRKAAGYE